MRNRAGSAGSGRLWAAVALTLVAGGTLAWVGFRALMERERSVETHYTATTAAARAPWYSASPDGRHIACTVTASGDTSKAECEVALMTIEGKRDKVLLPKQRPCAIPNAWSPDGRFLLLTMVGEGLRVLEVESGKSWPLHPDAKTDFQNPSRRTERLAWEGVTYEAVTRLMKARKTV